MLTDYDTGGIGASAGGLTAANFEVKNNRGVGIEVGGDVTIGTGTVCGNADGNLSAGGSQTLNNVALNDTCIE